MGLALFDLDHTLLEGDSDYLWARFLMDQGVLDAERYEATNQQFYADYAAGRLDIQAFLRFALAPLAQHPVERLQAWRAVFMREWIEPIIRPVARDAVAAHREAGDCIGIVTATNRFVTAPIAEAFGVDFLIATEPAMAGGRYTGEAAGVPSFREGKVSRVEDWLATFGAGVDWRTSYGYGDSRNDLPLLRWVRYPVAVDPDPILREAAEEAGWRIVSWAQAV